MRNFGLLSLLKFGGIHKRALHKIQRGRGESALALVTEKKVKKLPKNCKKVTEKKVKKLPDLRLHRLFFEFPKIEQENNDLQSLGNDLKQTQILVTNTWLLGPLSLFKVDFWP